MLEEEERVRNQPKLITYSPNKKEKKRKHTRRKKCKKKKKKRETVVKKQPEKFTLPLHPKKQENVVHLLEASALAINLMLAIGYNTIAQVESRQQ